MTAIGNGGHDEEQLNEEEMQTLSKKKIIQRLAGERSACAFVFPDGKRCAFVRVHEDDPDGRCLLPQHQK